jgi:hypothetical protein
MSDYYYGISKDGVMHIIEYTYPLFKTLCGKQAAMSSKYEKEAFAAFPNHCEECLRKKNTVHIQGTFAGFVEEDE